MKRPFEVGDTVFFRDISANRHDYPEKVGTTAVVKDIHMIAYADVMNGEPVFFALDIEMESGEWEWGLYSVRFALTQSFAEPSWEL